MTRPPCPKYPSDFKNYHEMRKPGCAHTIRLPEESVMTYIDLKCSLEALTTHADEIWFLFETAPAMQATLQSAAFRVVLNSKEDTEQHEAKDADPDVDLPSTGKHSYTHYSVRISSYNKFKDGNGKAVVRW
ncbi:hypothetical protein R1sor_002841 [Riccia sorocarpa]|uniref:Uncharacterized protein n=1 Tax=Riccia sorocarpa TaxID=122646 RepID=A0ABD3H3U8_9MARC